MEIPSSNSSTISLPPRLPVVPKWFGYYILIRNLDHHSSEEDIWRECGLENDLTVVFKGLTFHLTRNDCRRGSVMFSSFDKARRAAVLLNKKLICGRVVEAVHMGDYIQDICNVESMRITTKWRQKEFFPSDYEVSILVKCPRGWFFVRDVFEKYGTIKSFYYDVKSATAMISYTYLTEAYMAYLDFIEKVRMKRSMDVINIQVTGKCEICVNVDRL